MNGNKPHEEVHVDFLYMGLSNDDFKYLLVIRDDLSSYTWLCSATLAYDKEAADEFVKWISCF